MPAKKHLVFLVNPRSGVQRKKEIEEMVAKHLLKDLFTYEIQPTQYAHHGTLLASEAAKNGAYGVIAVGGDGSVNDVASGLAGTSSALGIIPMGSGNGMARTLGIPRNVKKALAILNEDHCAAIDMGYSNKRPFVSNAGMGFDAVISRAFSTSKKRGFLNYAWLSTRHLSSFQPETYMITSEGKTWQEKAFFINVANGKQFGYNFQIAPKASFTDGLLDVIIVRPFPKWQSIAFALRGFTGSLLDSKYVRHFQCREIQIKSEKGKLLQIDGDAHDCDGSVDFKIVPAALKVFIPK